MSESGYKQTSSGPKLRSAPPPTPDIHSGSGAEGFGFIQVTFFALQIPSHILNLKKKLIGIQAGSGYTWC